MKKTITLVTVIIILIPSNIRAEWIPLNQKTTSPTLPNINLISDDNTSTVIKIELSGFELKNLNSGDQNYQVINLLSESFTTDLSQPQLAYISKILAVPDQASVSVRNITLSISRESWLDGAPESTYTENPFAYSSMKSYPDNFTQLEKPSVFRNFRITRISIFPVQYIPAKKELQVASLITVRVNYGTGKIVNPKTTVEKANEAFTVVAINHWNRKNHFL